MRKQFIIIFSLGCLGMLSAGTPTEFTFGFTGGYDSNVLRFSADEFGIAALDPDLMGEAPTFDSFVYKLGSSFKKTLYQVGQKEFLTSGSFNWSDYRNNRERKYWSGGLDAVFKWGSYQNLKYSVHHLDSFYLRHYIDRDVTISNLTACAFSDRRQSFTLTQRIGRRQWASITGGYLQRYYERPLPSSTWTYIISAVSSTSVSPILERSLSSLNGVLLRIVLFNKLPKIFFRKV